MTYTHIFGSLSGSAPIKFLDDNFGDLSSTTDRTKGSSLVGYLNAGVNAVGRTVQVKLDDFVSVKDFGAKGDGVTNDSPSISSAFTAALGKSRVFFPNGTYFLSTPVTAPAGSKARFDAGAITSGSALSGAQIQYDVGQATATAGSIMQIDTLQEEGSRKVSSIGSFWTGVTRASFAVGKTFVSGDGAVNSPVIGILSMVSANGTAADSVGMLSVGSCDANNMRVWGSNLIATASAGVTNAFLVGLEIDVQPPTGVTIASGGSGLSVGAFNVAGLGSGIRLGSTLGGTFFDGLEVSGVTRAGVCVTAGSSMTSLIDATNGTYSGQAIKLAVGQTMTFGGAAGAIAATLNGDTSNNMNIKLASNALQVSGSNITEGSLIFASVDSSGIASFNSYVARGSGPNTTNAAIKVNGQSVTLRSINAGGTVNASGADYAEYETKRSDCGVLHKGSIVGFDEDGLLTDRFSLALRFGIKSTAPNLVGGDDWHTRIDPPPIEPNPPEPTPWTGGARPEMFRKILSNGTQASNIEQCEHAKKIEIDQAEFDQAMQAHQDANNVAYQKWLDTEHAAWRTAHAAWEVRFEALRATVDRIAYAGKCPVNVKGAKTGDYIIPIAALDDMITAIAVSTDRISFEQYKQTIGRVTRILPDGRAEIVVKSA